MQVGEFSSIVGMIKRTQTVFGSLFTVSGVICAFRKVAVLEAGLWNPAAMTDDVDLTLRVQIAGWYVDYVPQAMCWILMPETLRGLWKQRLRWATGGAQAALGITKLVIIKKAWRLIFIWLNFFISSLWAYCIWFCVLMFFIDLIFDIPSPYPSPIPDWWGTVLACTYIFQSLIGILLDLKYEKGSFRYIYWLIWYPIAFWLLSTSCALFGILIAIKRPKNIKGTWISPDRGIR
jgi:biofilm PGA synthesis N-glycosyltransferase PgaC